MDYACENTDRELYREPDKGGIGDYYSDSIHVTAQGGIGINVGGTVIVKTLAEWHKLALPPVDPTCIKCGHPWSNHPYRHPFVAMSQKEPSTD